MLVGLTFLAFAALSFAHLQAPVDEDMFLYWRRSEPNKCEPFTTQMIKCNKCVCSADGTSYCTRMVCINVKDEVLDKSEGEIKQRRKSRRRMSKTNHIKASIAKIENDESFQR